MTSPEPDRADVHAENAELLRRLEEAEATLRAIRDGSVDAVVVEGESRAAVYTLHGADRPYRVFVEEMQQAAVTLHPDGTIAYCNRRTAELLDRPHESVVASAMADAVAPEERPLFAALLEQARGGVAEGELHLLRPDGRRVPVLLAFNALPADCGASIGLLITDLTAQKHQERLTAVNTALRESEAQSRRQASQLRAFLDTAALGLHRVGPDGTILWANDAELDMFGYARDEYVGRAIAEFHVDAETVAVLMARLHRGEKVHDCMARIRCKDGTVKDVLIDASVLWDEGRFLHTQCFTRDITARLAAEHKLRESEALLREADRRKDQFLAMLSHELRNPLAPILNATQLLRLQATNENAVQQRAREVIERQTTTLAHLVDDLLDIARLTTGRIELRRSTVDLRQVVQHALETTAPLVAERRHRLEWSPPPDPLWVDADPTRLEEIAINLLSNAAKYTPDGGTIRVAVEADGGDAVVRVRDSGVGIDAAVMPHVFELFTQADRSLARSQGGLGIGLHIVQRLVELHGGQVAAHSDGLGKGSEFVVQLPRVAESAAAAPADTRPLDFDHQAVRVLVVDDNVDACATLALFLQLRGYSVQTAHTGPTAVEAACGWQPHIVLLDIGLPGADGYEVARQLRAHFDPAVMRLVAITGYGQEDDVLRSRAAGFDTHLLKPINPSGLDRLLEGWAHRDPSVDGGRRSR